MISSYQKTQFKIIESDNSSQYEYYKYYLFNLQQLFF